MRIPVLASVLISTAALVGLSACGGGGGFELATQSISVTSNVLPTTLSGQTVNYVIPLTGGCGGPYVMAVISGQLPPGLALNNANHSIEGVILQAGNYAFTIQIDDTGCTPFASTTQQFSWNIAVGPVAIVACDPPIIPLADYDPPNSVPFGDVDGMKTTVYGDFAVFNFTIAGGQPPYTFEIVDDPNDPLDSNWGAASMPQGMSIPPFSSSFIGAPQQTGGSIPFRITFRVTDALDAVGFRTLQWKVDTPPIVVATAVMANGKCGTAYSQNIQIVDGVPPFEFELTTTAGVNGTIVWQSPAAPIVNGGAITVDQVTGRANNKVTAASYPGLAVAGPYNAIIPEGIFLRETVGTFSGVPRRLGSFTCFLHVFSTLVPNEFGQHVWQTYTPNFANSEPPNIPTPAYGYGSFNTWLKEGLLLGALPYSTIPEFELGVPYNPDGGVAGLSLIAVGGVPKDGFTDGPHFSQVTNIDGTLPPPTQEYSGGYSWSIDWNPLLLGTVAPPGVTFTAHTGILTANPALLVRQSRQVFQFTTTDQQLPTTATHTISGRAAFSVGPDKVIITESTTSQGSTQAVSGFNDHRQTVRVISPLTSGAIFTNLSNATDMTQPGIPSTTVITSLATLLTNLDLVRVSVNPTGWWDDTHGLNPSGGRPFQHSDQNKSYTYSSMAWQSGSNPIPWNPNASAVDLPAAPSVVPNKPAGIYNDGGRLYGFQSATHFGVFVVRSDGNIYVPVAIDYSTGFSGFGDTMLQPYGPDTHSALMVSQMTISPNGRFAAMKLKTNTSIDQGAFAESAATTKIILFSLTGEQAFAGPSAWRIIDTGSNGSNTQGIYQYALSMALTDSYLYYICGNHLSTYSSFKEHAIYRYEITGGSSGGALLAPNAFTRWKNDGTSVANLMQTPFQRHDNPTFLQSVIGFGGTGTFSASFTTVSAMDTEMYAYDSWNQLENAVAPMPFRVSKNGLACAILAGQETNTFAASVDHMNHDVWVDHNGTLRQLSTIRRHSPQGAGRGYSLARGPSNFRHWGYYTGPTTGFEISDDATKVAVVVSRHSATVSPTSTSNWYNYRQDVIAWTTTTSWASSTEIQVTGTESGTPIFGGSQPWRFGALVFTADNAGLVFWGGYPGQNSSLSTSWTTVRNHSGTFYSWNFGTSALRGLFLTAAGGSDAGQATFTTASQVNPTFVGNSGSQGRIRPIGGWISRNRNFLYITTHSAISNSDQAGNTLVGINIRSLNTANSINGKTDGNGFRVLGQPSRRGFVPSYYYYPTMALEQRYYAPANCDGCGGQVMAKNSGYVFYASHWQAAGPSRNASTTSTFNGPDHATYWQDYGTFSGQIEGFSADVAGPVTRMTQTSFSQADNTTGRTMHNIECTDNGNALAFVYCNGGTTYNYGGEAVGYVQKIAFDASTGAILPGKVEWATTLTGGRAGDSMAIDTTGSKLYVAFGTGDETNKQITEVNFNSGTNAFTTRTFGTPRRYCVLSSGR